MTEEQKTIKCPKCGTENSTDDKFCQECGKNLAKYIYNKNEKLTKVVMFPTIIEIIVCFVIAIVLIICSVAANPPFIDFNTDTTDGNVFQQIYDLTGNVGFLVEKIGANLSLCLSILFGLITAFILWGVFKFNRIERRIIETQEMIKKRG